VIYSFKTWKHKAGTPEHVDFMLTSPAIWKNDFRDTFEAIDVRDHVNLDALKVSYAKDFSGFGFDRAWNPLA
jgi:hypothetical protein